MEGISIFLVSDVLFLTFLGVWYLTGIILNFGFGQSTVIRLFVDNWDPYIQGILGIFFAARVIGYAIATIQGKTNA